MTKKEWEEERKWCLEDYCDQSLIEKVAGCTTFFVPEYEICEACIAKARGW